MLHLLCLIIYFYLAASTLYLLIVALAGRFANGKVPEISPLKKKIAVIIPAYKEDSIIIDTAERCARHNYPTSLFKVIVIADFLKEETMDKLRGIPVDVLPVKFTISTKARSVHAALTSINEEGFDIVMMLDADNVMSELCLERVNTVFQKGSHAIQCHRSAKNKNTPVAQLDGISEEININLFRRGPAALGLSAMPLGSGMAFEFGLLKSIFDAPGILDNPAEDREIEIQLMKRGIRMVFLNSVYVFDEKVTDAGVFQKQRIRWLEAQLNHVRRFFKPDLLRIRRSPVYYNIFFQSLLLPRLLFLLVCGIIATLLFIQIFFDISLFYPPPSFWIIWIITYFFVLLVSVPAKFYSLKTLKAIGYIPALMISMLMAILKLKRNRKEFLHTSKTFNDGQ